MSEKKAPRIIESKRPSLHLDYFRDDKNRICQVLTWHHPRDRRLSIVKYDLGESHWTSRETGLRYKRILKSYSLEGHQDNLQLVKEIEPDYFYFSKVYGVEFLAVPNTRILQYYFPEDRLQEILNGKHNDDIESKVRKLAELLHDNLHIPFEDMGITGSILWKGQTIKSDIDFMIYGNRHAKDFNDHFPTIYEAFPEITPMTDDKTNRYVRSMAKKSGLPITIAKKYIEKKTWLSIYGGTDLSLIFSPKPIEIPFQYGDEIFKPHQPVDIECTISKSDLGSAYPSIYEIVDYKFLTAEPKEFSLPINRILSFEGALTGYFKEGDHIVVRGLLESVRTNDKREFGQVILGTGECNGNEFILLKEDYNSIVGK